MNIFIGVYDVTFSDPDTGNVIYSAPFSTCGKDTCETDITPPSLMGVCPSSVVRVSADYGLGLRLLSGPITIGMCHLLMLHTHIINNTQPPIYHQMCH